MSLILVIWAPILFKGFMMRAIGRWFKESSPFRTQEKSCPARMPDISRVVVPLFPTSSIPSGAVRPCRPFPCTRMLEGRQSMSMPILRKHLMVARQSAPVRKLVISVVPWAIAPSMMLRWEIDLSPGTVISPFKFFALAIVLTLINDIPEFLQ